MAKKTKSKKVKVGQTVELHYVGTLDDGTEFDSSRAREETMTVEVGSGVLLAGFDEALHGMKVGETKTIQLSPEQAYGVVNPEAYRDVPHSVFSPDAEIEVGFVVQGQSEDGRPLMARIDKVEEEHVTLNFNHPLAGQTLNFEIELVNIQEGGE